MDLVHLLITCTPSPSIQLDIMNISVFVGWLGTVDTMANAKLSCLEPTSSAKRYHGPMDLWSLIPFKPFELLKNCIECGTNMMIQPHWLLILPQHHQNGMVSYEITDLRVDKAHFWQAAAQRCVLPVSSLVDLLLP